MNDKLETKLKEFLPYIIIIGVVYLFLPAVLRIANSSIVFNNIVYIGVFPLTAFICNMHYGYKKTNDMILSFVAPVIYIPSMLLYGNLKYSVINSLVLLVCYFISGYIGLTVGEMLKGGKSDDKESSKKKRVPSVVNTATAKDEEDVAFDDIVLPQQFEEDQSVEVFEPEFVPTDDYTEDDIDAILKELHTRND
ncbi:MAG: hypothetical protein IJO20_01830 [Ruminococcus sp.]|nr:hypothetical protein [Ruminococcus sp.]